MSTTTTKTATTQTTAPTIVEQYISHISNPEPQKLGLYAFLRLALQATTCGSLIDAVAAFTRSWIESDKLLRDDCSAFTTRQGTFPTLPQLDKQALVGVIKDSLPAFEPFDNSIQLSGQQELYKVAVKRVTATLWVALTQSEPIDAMELADRIFGRPKSADSLKSQGNLLSRISRQLNNRVDQSLAGLDRAKSGIKEAKVDIAKRIAEEPDKVTAQKYFSDRRRKQAQATTTRKG